MKEELKRLSVIVPTYNEVENVGLLLEEICSILADWDYQIIVVDDNSPDGTYEVVERMSAANPRIQGIRRPGKLGLGSAVLEGFRASTGDLVAMMDSDLSHQPRDLEALLTAAKEADIIVGSRYVVGGHIQGWSPLRHLASRVATRLSRFILGLSVKDTLSGFAVFRRETLERIAPRLNPIGFKLLLEVLVRSPQAQVKEVPITFVNRSRGRSKFGSGEIFAFLRLCLALRRHRKLDPASFQ